MNNDFFENNNQNDNETSNNSTFSNTETADERYNPYDFSEGGESLPQPSQGLAIASLVLGIASLVCCFGRMIMAVLAIVFSSVAKKRGNTSGYATAGKVIGIISLVFWGLIFLLYIVIFAAMIAELG